MFGLSACQPASKADPALEIAVAVAWTQTASSAETEKALPTESLETPTPESLENDLKSEQNGGSDETPGSIFPVESAVQRIQFDPGKFSLEITNQIAPGGLDHYVLNIGAEQQIETTIYPPGVVTVVISGEDGTTLKSELDNLSTWAGTIPTTQDYFIDITSVVGIETRYTLTITIPPLTPIATTGQISGSISYGGEANPPLHIVAYNLESNLWYFLKTSENTFFFEIGGLPPGTYNLVAYSQENMASGHLAPITVNAGETTKNINFTDWVDADSAAFPPDPVRW